MSEKMAFSTGGNACCPILAFVPAQTTSHDRTCSVVLSTGSSRGLLAAASNFARSVLGAIQALA